MTIDKMRDYLCKFYGDAWRIRVMNMPDNQVIAVYKNFIKTGKKPERKTKNNKYKQMTIFDYMEV